MTTTAHKLFRAAPTATALPLLLLLAIISSPPAWAGAFSTPTSMIHRRHVDGLVDGPRKKSFHMNHHKSFARGGPESSPSSVLSLTRLLFLRGGQQDDETVDETASLDASQQTYGSAAQDQDQDDVITSQDEEASPEAVEMTESHPAEPVEVEEEGAPASDKYKIAEEEAESLPRLYSPSVVLAPVTSALHTAAKFYTTQLSDRPVLTKSLTAGVIFGLSDWCAQLIEERDEESEGTEISPIVLTRILAAFLVGVLFFGPAANAWYAWIFKILPSTSLASTLQKAALGQVIFGPAFTCVFFGAGMIQSGTFTPGAWLSKIRTDLPGVWASGLGYWPLVDFISYKVVPVQWIPLFVNFCSFVWTIYLSLVANRGKVVEE